MGWLRRKRDSAALDRAYRVGFLVANDSRSPALRQFEEWCRQKDRPLVWIRPCAQCADIILDMGPCSWHLAAEAIEELELLLAMTAPHRRARLGTTYCRIYGVPSGQAEVVAFRLFDLVMESRPELAQSCGHGIG
ncbi:MAG: hypothetical protein IRY99_07855 [Isosphaeraceae bacterium]|nr:hypothetical protein [Isosphaeraceae bacterium]